VLSGDLERAGLAVTCAFTGAEGLALARSRAFAVIVLDLMLPDIAGTEVLKQLRFYGNTTPVVVLTGYPTYETARKVGAWHATAYLTKPMFGEPFVAAVRNAMTFVDEWDRRPVHVVGALDRALATLASIADFPASVLAQAGGMQVQRALVEILAEPGAPLPAFLAACRFLGRSRTTSTDDLADLACSATDALRAALEPSVAALDPRVRDLAAQLFDRPPGRQPALTLRAVADAWSLTPFDATALLKREIAVDLRGLLRIARCRPALQRLVIEAEQVSQIAYSVGYEHPSQLDHDIKRLLGVTPSVFRRISRGQLGSRP
jgi:CheY-like chemotaxis protein/AraC-like DNA-binding protein